MLAGVVDAPASEEGRRDIRCRCYPLFNRSLRYARSPHTIPLRRFPLTRLRRETGKKRCRNITTYRMGACAVFFSFGPAIRWKASPACEATGATQGRVDCSATALRLRSVSARLQRGCKKVARGFAAAQRVLERDSPQAHGDGNRLLHRACREKT